MDNSGDIAERIIKVGMDGAVMTLKLSGTASKHLAVLLYSVLNDKEKTKGRVKLTSLLKSGKELKVFTLSESNLKRFAKEAKRYGVTYCALRDSKVDKNHPVEIMCKAEDASKINRIFERLDFDKVDSVGIESEIEEKVKNAKMLPMDKTEAAKKDDKIIDHHDREAGDFTENPFYKSKEKNHQSDTTSKKPKKEEKILNKKASVREEIKSISKKRKEAENIGYGNKNMSKRETELEKKTFSSGKSKAGTIPVKGR